jgi:hypothetical protein
MLLPSLIMSSPIIWANIDDGVKKAQLNPEKAYRHYAKGYTAAFFAYFVMGYPASLGLPALFHLVSPSEQTERVFIVERKHHKYYDSGVRGHSCHGQIQLEGTSGFTNGEICDLLSLTQWNQIRKGYQIHIIGQQSIFAFKAEAVSDIVFIK